MKRALTTQIPEMNRFVQSLVRRPKNSRTPTIAKAMLKGRAVDFSEDFQPYWRFHVAREHGRLQASGDRHIVSRKAATLSSIARGNLEMLVNTETDHETSS